MKKTCEIPEDKKWEAVSGCDKSYDGLFFYGVKTTGVFCRPSCKSKTPLKENTLFFESFEEAVKAGFRPCKRCCPDKEFFEPELELVEKAKDMLCREYNKPMDLSTISKELGISSSHFTRLFKNHTGISPLQYMLSLRIEKASDMLRKKDINILEAASLTGFNSLSNFYKCFKEFKGCTPREYKRSRSNF